jgi:hypothetical protein
MTIRINPEQSQKLDKYRLNVKTTYDPQTCLFNAYVRDALTGEQVASASHGNEQQAIDDGIEAVSDRHEPLSRLEMEKRLKELEQNKKPSKKKATKKTESSANVVRTMHDSAKDDD